MCEHANDFDATVHVHRVTDGKTTNYVAEVQLLCKTCQERFSFVGLNSGVSLVQPTASFDGLVARLPVIPSGVVEQPLPDQPHRLFVAPPMVPANVEMACPPCVDGVTQPSSADDISTS